MATEAAAVLPSGLMELWTQRVKPVVQQKLRSSNLPGAYDMTFRTLRRYDDVRVFLKHNMMPSNEPSKHVNLPALTNTVTRALPFESAGDCSVALVAAVVWDLELCDKRQWRIARSPASMYVSGQFFDNVSQYQLVPRGIHMPSYVPSEFRARVVVTAAMLSRCVQDDDCAAGFRFRVAGIDFVIGYVYRYHEWICQQLRAGAKPESCVAREAIKTVIPVRALELAARATTVWDCVELEPYDTLQEPSLHYKFEWALVSALAVAILDHHVYYSGLTPTEVQVLRAAKSWDNMRVYRLVE